MSQDIKSINTSQWRQWSIFTNVKILFEFISYFFEYKHFMLDILFQDTRSSDSNTSAWTDHFCDKNVFHISVYLFCS